MQSYKTLKIFQIPAKFFLDPFFLENNRFDQIYPNISIAKIPLTEIF